MKYKHIVPVAVLFLGLLSCTKDHDGHGCNNNTENTLAGNWKWTKSTGGIAGITETPQSTGKNVELRLATSQYAIYTNGVLTSQGTYTIETRNCIHDNTSKSFLVYSGAEQGQMVESLDNATLRLSDDVYDGFMHHYVRE